MSKYQDCILDLINSTQKHWNAEQIFFELKKKYPKVVQATVYNNLNALVKEGRIRRIATEGLPDRFDKITPHDHLFCTICHELSDIRLPDFSHELEEAVQVPIESYDLRINWVCPSCRSKMN